MAATKARKNNVSADLKALQVRLSEAEFGYQSACEQLEAYRKTATTYREEMQRLQREIERLKGSQRDFIVSEHAIIRYIERVMGIDLDTLKEEILPEVVMAQARILGNGVYPASCGKHRVKIRDGVVVTVLGPDE
jgi:DNA repair ATPase RecN